VCRASETANQLLPGGDWYLMTGNTNLWLNELTWQSASTVESLVNLAIVSNNQSLTNTVTEVLATTYKLTGGLPTDCKYFDDMGWWALAWARSYQLTRNQTYLAESQKLFNYILANGWEDSTCGGGCWWGPNTGYKNAIANELLLAQAATLSLITGDTSTLNWAVEEWNWFTNSGIINANHLVNDGLNVDSNNKSHCTNNGQTTWTYNQGVVLSVCWLFQQNKLSSEVSTADQIATATTKLLINSAGILSEPCESSTCDNDQLIFKGVFIRYLWYFITNPTVQKSISSQSLQNYQNFIQTNANAAWSKYRDNSRPAGPAFGVHWNGPLAQVSAATQSAALDLFIAAAYSTSSIPSQF